MSRRRFRPTDAFVDESIRGRRYLMACVVVEARDKPEMRSLVSGFAGTRRSRVHVNGELEERRKELLRTFGELNIATFVVVC